MVRNKLVKILMTKTRPLVGPQEILYNNADYWKAEKQKTITDVGLSMLE